MAASRVGGWVSNFAMELSALLKPAKLWTRTDCLVRASPVPREAGVYVWYFVTPPPGVPVEECHRAQEATLLYVGISPRQPSARDGGPSRQTLRSRIRNHYRGNAAGSTLRLTLGCLLEGELGITLQRAGHGDRSTFGEGEGPLSEWMGRNALVTWMPTGAVATSRSSSSHRCLCRLTCSTTGITRFMERCRRCGGRHGFERWVEFREGRIGHRRERQGGRWRGPALRRMLDLQVDHEAVL